MNTKKDNGTSFPIVGGPSKDTIFDACKYACSPIATIKIEFSVALGYTMPKDDPGCAALVMYAQEWTITSIQHEDGSGESFILHGYCKTNLGANHEDISELATKKFKAYYNTRKREGTILFT